MFKVVFTGDRNWTNKRKVEQTCDKLPPGTIIVVGDCSGLDYLITEYGKSKGLEVKVYKAQWNVYGLAAGPLRNKLMNRFIEIENEKPDMIFAFHNNIEKSKGTINTLNIGRKSGIPCYLFTDTSESSY